MRILLDQGTPAPLRRALADHSVATAYEKGWDKLTNGELLAAAEGSFDVFITTDQNLRYQQNLTGRRVAILVLPTTSWPRLQPHAVVGGTWVLRVTGRLELEYGIDGWPSTRGGNGLRPGTGPANR